jgi:hypothetical protein
MPRRSNVNITGQECPASEIFAIYSIAIAGYPRRLVGRLKALLDLKLAPRLLAMSLIGGQGTFEDWHWNRHEHVELLSLESQPP